MNKVSAAGLLIAMGIIYGDIGTSPLYVFNAIIKGRVIDEALILGSLSCILWTITLQTTLKYVWLILRADNKGEGGIFSLFALVRRRKKWLVVPAMIGGASLLADGIITPPISITSAIEGLRKLPPMHDMPQGTIVSIVLVIITMFFIMQQFGTASIGRLFGPVMFVWFTMLGVLGVVNLHLDYSVFKAINPVYAINLLTQSPGGFWLLGAVFLCTTGAEALYSDLGHCGRPNIRISWIYVKIVLLLNYFGQGAYMLSHNGGKTMTLEMIESGQVNAFFDIMPQWFIIPGVAIATMAAIIASQAMISGSFTLISEATRLNLWPKMKINYPTEAKGQLFIPGMNMFMYFGCVLVVIYFQSSSNMEAAYGLAIIMTMLMSTILFANYMVLKRIKAIWIYVFLAIYLSIEIAFLAANIIKFPHGGYATFIVAGLMFAIMFVWFKSRKIKNRYVEFVKMDEYIHMLQDLSNDLSIPKYSTHLVYLTSANNPHEIEHKIIYSILNKKPKRADIYWFVHVDVLDEPYRTDYVVDTIIPNEIIRVEFRLGFREEHRINLMFRKVVEDMVKNKEVNITSRYTSLQRNKVAGDWQFIVMEKFLSHDNDLPLFERIIMKLYFMLKKISLSEEKGFGLDSSFVTVEKFPLVVSPVSTLNLRRIEKDRLDDQI
ncbi:MAG: KUP/HAK/KT family potassium transporter [Chitinophagaceae bacterium]